ncbi:thioredoxin domain-containing protein [Carboxydothermus pertinax]|uniref:Thioredoxin n=1 Tax=Carboxydothermus pertinax TaxID=870242 RepID=A0A1L8CXF5_9THEO|nr:thioredoxin domain-containing protein [Carboxydothermus pertinax]GAV23539.1 thioredoxin [Carboxydothermus pertinax]
MTTEAKRQPNRLIHEKSPYLLQHAYNPVDWYPWGEDAFKKAKMEDKPVFLSIGYSTCHWCHVMERESFENEEVADLLNKHFVAIKVDREERPDVDQIYMTACQAMTGQGGWPLTIIMTPEKKPFFAGTYFPKRSKWGRPGLIEILTEIAKLWETDREQLLTISKRLYEFMQTMPQSKKGDLTEEVLEKAYREFLGKFDSEYGGFGPAPKFPTPHNLIFLFRYWKRTGEEKALVMAEKTLEAMARGGIYDHVGYGFHRYSTDREWLVPHFEKMLYDNALLAYTYLEAYQATKKEKYARVAREVFTYVKRKMTSPEGGFYSAEDADSEGVEGKYYAWTPDEVKKALGPEEGELFCRVYDITPEGNFEGKNIPNLIHTDLESMAVKFGKSSEELTDSLDRMRQKLYQGREKRVLPHKDDKILTSWNGLMIAALAKGVRVLQDQELLNMAQKAAEFIFSKLRRDDGRLLARYREGEGAVLAYLDDYAFLIWGLIELYEASFEVRYLKLAVELTREMLKLFWDEKHGGLFFTGADGEELITRPKEIYDGALPSGNSVAALNLLRLSRMLGEEDFLQKAEEILSTFAGKVSEIPSAHSFYLLAYLFYLGPVKEIVVAGEPDGEDTRAMIEKINLAYLPNSVVLFHPIGDAGQEIREIIPHIADKKSLIGERATVYVCENFSCKAPVVEVEMLEEYLM